MNAPATRTSDLSPAAELTPTDRAQAGGSVAGARRARLAARLLVASILLLALVHGLLYASYMPPWGLVDEGQHLHYIQLLAEERRVPTAHQDLLSPEILQSLFATRRWETVLHHPPPASSQPADMGLEAYSYQGFHPPLYYALLAPIYGALPDDILAKLYALRWLTVGLSLATICIALRCTQELFPGIRSLPYAVALLIAVLPERTMAISRVNNDALVEVLAAGLVWAAIRAHRCGLNPRRSALLGGLFGLGVLSKVTMGALAPILAYLLLAQRPRRDAIRCAMAMGLSAAIFIAPLVARNLVVYGDLTGFSGFSTLMATVGGFSPPAVSISAIVGALIESLTHVWFIWWKGAHVAGNAVVWTTYGVLLVAMGGAAGGLALLWSDERQARGTRDLRFGALLLASGPLYAILAIASLFRGEVPVVQGRFLLPALIPCAIGLVLGLWRLRWGRWAYGAVVALLAVMSGALLFGNLLPYAYFWSAIALGAVPFPEGGLSWSFVWSVAAPRLLGDKPAFLRPLMPILAPLYIASLAGVAASLYHWYRWGRDAS